MRDKGERQSNSKVICSIPTRLEDAVVLLKSCVIRRCNDYLHGKYMHGSYRDQQQKLNAVYQIMNNNSNIIMFSLVYITWN